jgi:drug/metabolite transporter (DMT)-like permease
MHIQLFIAILAGLGGMIGWGLADFFGKKTIDVIGDTVTLFWAHICGTITLVVLGLLQLILQGHVIAIPHDYGTWFGLLFFGTLQAIVYLLVYRGFSKGQVAVLNPIFASYAGLTALISMSVFGETVSNMGLGALLIIFCGILLMSLDISALRTRRFQIARTPGLLEIAVATILAAVWTISWDRFVSGHDWLAYALFMYAFMTLILFGFAKLQKIRLIFNNRSMWKYLALIGICEATAYVAISVGYSTTTYVSIVALLSGGFSLPVIILARIFLKERPHLFQTIGSGLIILGIVLLPLL